MGAGKSGFFDRLAANWNVVQFDPRGCGMSGRNVEDFTLEARLRDLEAVVDKLGLERFVLHGLGWSGPMAVTYAARNPDRVSHLILDDTQARTQDFMYAPRIRALDALTTDWDAFLEYLVFTIYGVGRDEGKPYVEFMRGCVTQEDALKVFEVVVADDVTDLLPQLRVPTLILQHSGTSQVESAKDLAAQIPGATLVLLKGGALDDTDTIIKAIGDHTGVDTSGSSVEHGHPHDQSGVRAILFTDVVNHTSMMGRLGDAAGREVLREHEELTRRMLLQHGGAEVKTMGDGFMASFGSVTGAVECAIQLQREFAKRNETSAEPVVIRVGLNAGEPIEDGGDLFGATVIMAARIASHAEGGEVLASDVVRGLCSGKGFLFADRGENVLRGFEDAVRLYEVGWRE